MIAASSVLSSPTLAVVSGADTTRAEQWAFWLLAGVMVFSALGLLFARKAVHAALSMAMVMISLGAVYLVQDAEFLGGVQIFVYTGAVMMLFLFVLMFIGVNSADARTETIPGQRVLGFVLGGALGATLLAVIANAGIPRAKGLTEATQDGAITGLALKIFGDWVFAFEVTSALLITAVIGAMILAHRERLTPRPTQAELSARRIKDGLVKAPLPAPGVFARSNAVDTPALLPDGTPSELSVSRVLVARGQTRSSDQLAEQVAEIEAEIVDPLDRTVITTGPAGVDEVDTTGEVAVGTSTTAATGGRATTAATGGSATSDAQEGAKS
ncbi:MAG: NADH-quinone oxidoreductase subunit J [Kineosporiaceae bacterium]